MKSTPTLEIYPYTGHRGNNFDLKVLERVLISIAKCKLRPKQSAEGETPSSQRRTFADG